MNDQDRIEMAADNCEVLRARLAKYEDAEGRPLQVTIPDALAKIGAFLLGEGEIDGHSFGDARPDMDGMFWWRKELRAALESQAREIERLGLMVSQADYSYDCDRAQFERELAALKARLGGVVLRDALVKIIEMNRQHAADQYGDADKAESWSCVTVAREALNSSPVSAGDDEEYMPAGIVQMIMHSQEVDAVGLAVKSLTPAGGVDERAAFEVDFDKRTNCNNGVAYYVNIDGSYCFDDIQKQWKAWQARAALSAPSHGEQVREDE